ncbi:MAG: sulfite exporter TauE/SafE family protein [Anaerolineae bacterium]|nr:sulfite exporter TauE/SafE family protein [Anaerolineae bacterium]
MNSLFHVAWGLTPRLDKRSPLKGAGDHKGAGFQPALAGFAGLARRFSVGRRLAVIIAVLLALTLPTVALAHPLGNFTTNRYSRLEIGDTGLRLRYILDLAEIPAFQEIGSAVDTDRDGQVSAAENAAYAQRKAADLRSKLSLVVAGMPTDLSLTSYDLSFPEGQGGLKTLRLALWFEAPLRVSQGQLAYRDDNYPDRLGWKEVVVQAADGGQIDQSSASSADVSQELHIYPQDMLTSPLNVSAATVRYTVGVADSSPPPAAQTAVLARPNDALAELVGHEALSLPVILTSLLIAFGLGMAHALSPGHGKTMVGAYLVGSRGTWRHALFLGLTVTVTHTAGVFALGLVTLFAQQYILPEQLYPWLSVLSGLLVAGIGVTLIVARLRGALRGGSDAHDHDGLGFHTHGPGGHTHAPASRPQTGRITWRSLLALGVSGGLLPCPSALVVLLSAISLHRVGFGMLLIVAFSLGLAGVLVAIGLALVFAGRFVERQRVGGRLVRLLPAVSALVITLVGLVMTVQALAQVGLWHGPTVLAWLNL